MLDRNNRCSSAAVPAHTERHVGKALRRIELQIVGSCIIDHLQHIAGGEGGGGAADKADGSEIDGISGNKPADRVGGDRRAVDLQDPPGPANAIAMPATAPEPNSRLPPLMIAPAASSVGDTITCAPLPMMVALAVPPCTMYSVLPLVRMVPLTETSGVNVLDAEAECRRARDATVGDDLRAIDDRRAGGGAAGKKLQASVEHRVACDSTWKNLLRAIRNRRADGGSAHKLSAGHAGSGNGGTRYDDLQALECDGGAVCGAPGEHGLRPGAVDLGTDGGSTGVHLLVTAAAENADARDAAREDLLLPERRHRGADGGTIKVFDIPAGYRNIGDCLTGDHACDLPLSRW